MANTGFKGSYVRQTGTVLLFRVFLQTGAGAKLTTGTTVLSLYEVQSDGTLKSFDFNDNTFKTTALTTATLAMTHRTGNNSTVNTGIWTAALGTLTGFTVGAMYLVQVNNAAASPTDQTVEFQYGSAPGDLVTTANGTGTAELGSDVKMVAGNAASAGGAVTFPTTLASQTDVLNNTVSRRVFLGIPPFAVPSTGTQAYTVVVAYYDQTGAPEAPTGTPVVTVKNAAGTDRSSQLGTVTVGSTTNEFTVTYTVNSTDPAEQLIFKVLATVNAVSVPYYGTTEVAAAGAAGSVTVGGYAAGQDPFSLLMNAVNGVETGYTVKSAMRLMFAVLCGKSSNSGNTFRDVNDTVNRITATTDSSGNRSAVALNAG